MRGRSPSGCGLALEPRLEGKPSTQYNPDDDYLAEEMQNIYLSRAQANRAAVKDAAQETALVRGIDEHHAGLATDALICLEPHQQSSDRLPDQPREYPPPPDSK